MRVTVLGCGASPGVPVIGCDCEVCTSKNPKNKRTRVSVLVETNGKNLLIDSSPDLRQQALANNIRHVDVVLYTHDHADHTHGLDDLRSFNYLVDSPLEVYGNAETIGVIKQRFAYAFQEKPQKIWYRPALVAKTLPEAAIANHIVHKVKVTHFAQLHGRVKTLGYRIGNFAYSTDTDALPEASFEALAGVDVWVVDCLRYTPSASHSYLERTLEWIARVKPRQAVLTHMAHELEYEKLSKELPKGVVPGYDGMVLDVK